MSADTYTVLRCDGPRCRAKFPAKGLRFGMHQSVRAAAGLEGWLWSSSRGDFCPKHTEVLRPSTSGSHPEGGAT